MTIQTFRDRTVALFDTCDDLVGDTIQYRAAGRATFATIPGKVEYTEALRDIGTGQVIDQDIAIEVQMTFVPIKPTTLCRVRLQELAGLTFKPVSTRANAAGIGWVFELLKTNA